MWTCEIEMMSFHFLYKNCTRLVIQLFVVEVLTLSQFREAEVSILSQKKTMFTVFKWIEVRVDSV